MNNKNLTHILEGSQDGSLLDEILFLAKETCPAVDLDMIRKVHGDLIAFFFRIMS